MVRHLLRYDEQGHYRGWRVLPIPGREREGGSLDANFASWVLAPLAIKAGSSTLLYQRAQGIQGSHVRLADKTLQNRAQGIFFLGWNV